MHILVRCLAITYNLELNIFEGTKTKANFWRWKEPKEINQKVNKKLRELSRKRGTDREQQTIYESFNRNMSIYYKVSDRELGSTK